MVSNFALCGMPFLAGFYSRDFILEMFSMRYINMFGFLLLFLSTGLTVCYSFRLFYFVLCADFNFIPSYSIVEVNYNMVSGMVGLWLAINRYSDKLAAFTFSVTSLTGILIQFYY